MSFKPFKFVFNPPATIPSPLSETETIVSGSGLTSSLPPSNAASLISQLQGLVATSGYLQQAILERFKNTAIKIDLSANPAVSEALSRVYAVDPPPDAISMAMFSHLLDAEAAVVQTDMALGKDSQITVNPIQAADFATLTSFVEKQLVESGRFQHQLPTLLRSLKADQLVFSTWQSKLVQYPVLRTSQTVLGNVNSQGPLAGQISTTTVDLDQSLFDYSANYMNRYSSIYSTIYAMMAKVNDVEAGVIDAVNLFVIQPIADVVRIIALFNGLKGLFHKDSLGKIVDAMGGFVFARMAAEIGGVMYLVDRFVNMAVRPLRNAVGNLGRVINTMNKTAAEVGHATEGLKGIGKTTLCGTAPHNQDTDRYSHKDVSIPGLGTGDSLPRALQVLGEHLTWGIRSSDRHRLLVNESFKKINERRLKEQRDRLDVMCSLKSLDSLLAIANGVVKETQSGTTFPTANSAQRVEAVGRILTSLQTGSGTTFTVQDGQVFVTPPFMPTPSAEVEGVLRTGGLQRITDQDIVRVRGVIS